MQLERVTRQPILEPVSHHEWEKACVFNCASVLHGGLVHMIYRATNTEDPDSIVSSLGYAVSRDGTGFFRMDKPVFTGEGDGEKAGCEDPRITRIGGEFFMVYISYSGRYGAEWHDTRISMASTKNFIEWKRWGTILEEKDNKDAALFPEKIKGRYFLLHRRKPSIWLASSGDFFSWKEHRAVMDPLPGTWESQKIGIAGPPHLTRKGWLLFYHGVDDRNVYRLGAALLDLKDPYKVIFRMKEPILSPELEWEKTGAVPNVVFSCGSVRLNDRYLVYYGGADKVIGVAQIPAQMIENMI